MPIEITEIWQVSFPEKINKGQYRHACHRFPTGVQTNGKVVLLTGADILEIVKESMWWAGNTPRRLKLSAADIDAYLKEKK